MAANQDLRLSLASDVSKLLAHPEVESIFPARLASGKRNIVIALPTDTCGHLLGRLAGYRASVNVVVGSAKPGEFDVIVFHRSGHESSPAGESDECTVGESSELGLLVALLRKTRKMTKVLVQPRYDAELVDRDEEEFAGV